MENSESQTSSESEGGRQFQISKTPITSESKEPSSRPDTKNNRAKNKVESNANASSSEDGLSIIRRAKTKID